MKLYEYKTRAMIALMNYEPKNPRERQLIDMLMIKINNLRAVTLPRLLMDIYEIIHHENVSEEFKQVLKKLIPSEEEARELIEDG
ncbi:MAG: hypothetical protein GXO32_03315 [Crenarchaeota archaeon]|nr:hypothetical protein [Thermoproteota archaeon]